MSSSLSITPSPLISKSSNSTVFASSLLPYLANQSLKNSVASAMSSVPLRSLSYFAKASSTSADKFYLLSGFSLAASSLCAFSYSFFIFFSIVFCLITFNYFSSSSKSVAISPLSVISVSQQAPIVIFLKNKISQI